MTYVNVRKRLLALVVAVVVTHAWGQEPGKPVVNSRFQKVEATVETINPATREVALRGPKGRLFSVVAGDEVKNFDKMHAGDKVVVSYYEGIAAQMAKDGNKVAEPAGSTFAYSAKSGARPSGGAGASVTTTVTIEDINAETNTVAFKRSDGSVHVIAVKSPNMQEFIRTLKRGDSVEVTYTESVAVNVVPAAS